jgi:hypothetical protein
MCRKRKHWPYYTGIPHRRRHPFVLYHAHFVVHWEQWHLCGISQAEVGNASVANIIYQHAEQMTDGSICSCTLSLLHCYGFEPSSQSNLYCSYKLSNLQSIVPLCQMGGNLLSKQGGNMRASQLRDQNGEVIILHG